MQSIILQIIKNKLEKVLTFENKFVKIYDVVKQNNFTRMAVMFMSKDLSIGILLDFYGDLLTEKQRDTLDLYYNKDYSLAEIAEDLDISRQGVRDFIKRGEKQLHDFEDSLKMEQRFNIITKEAEDIEKLLSEMNSVNVVEKKAKVSEKINKIKKAL